MKNLHRSSISYYNISNKKKYSKIITVDLQFCRMLLEWLASEPAVSDVSPGPGE